MHICHFFETARDVVDTVLPFFEAGIELGERCVWLIGEPLDEGTAGAALRGVPGAGRAVQVIDARRWYMRDGSFVPELLRPELDALIADALRDGFTGLRISGCQGWQRDDDWAPFGRFEDALEEWTSGRPVLMLCSYPLSAVGAADIMDIALRHHRVIARRRGTWEVLETPDASTLRTRNRQQAAVAMLGQTAIRERDLHAVMCAPTTSCARTCRWSSTTSASTAASTSRGSCGTTGS
jgi:hypothetical protein